MGAGGRFDGRRQGGRRTVERQFADTLRPSHYLMTKLVLPPMIQASWGRIINISSINAKIAAMHGAAYVASKHGVVGVTKAAALECAKIGIRVNAVCPGVIRTPMIDSFLQNDPERERSMTEMEPVGRMGTTEEVANVVLWLCSDAASFVTGHALAVDGGIVAQSGNYPPVPE